MEPETDEAGAATGFYLVTIGEGRRLALCLLAKRKAIKKAEPVRCVVDLTNDPHEISLDENITRFRHASGRRVRGVPAPVGGARPVAPRRSAPGSASRRQVVRQRLRLGAVSPC